jgi:ubiquinone/menaquinone biosynthesis C-methylase UbiE
VAADASAAMLALARKNVERAGLAGRIRLELCDAKRLPFPDGSFGAVISNSIAHHIPEPKAVLAQMVRVASPGAVLFVRDLLRPRDRDELVRLVADYAGGANARQQAMFAASLHAALTVDEVRGLVAALGLDPQTVRQTSDRHWTWQTRR